MVVVCAGGRGAGGCLLVLLLVVLVLLLLQQSCKSLPRCLSARNGDHVCPVLSCASHTHIRWWLGRIHGGGLQYGTGADPFFDGAKLAVEQRMVVVTINCALTTSMQIRQYLPMSEYTQHIPV